MAEHLDLLATPDSPGIARRFVAGHVAAWGYRHLVEDVQLMTSEVVSNAVLHVGHPCMVGLEDLGGGVRVTVHDPSHELPTPRQPEPWEPNGRGLGIVAALASSWGVRPVVDDGKAVWFELSTER